MTKPGTHFGSTHGTLRSGDAPLTDESEAHATAAQGSAGGLPTLDEAIRSEREQVIPIVEEEARIEKRESVTGRVRVRTHVDLVQEPVRASLQEETVEVTRVPVNRDITAMPEVRTENGVTIVPVVEEVLVVEKRLVLKEELHIRRQTRTEEVEVPVELRKERVEVERIPAEGTTDAQRAKK